MKHILLSILGALLLATALQQLLRRQAASEHPVLYWVADASAPRVEQLELFHAWLEEKGYPKFEVRLDSSNRDVSKKLIQGVSGVGADILSMARDEAWLLHSTGMLEDLRPLAEKHGFTLDQTWPAAANNYMMDGEQMGFPGANPVQIYLINRDLFEQHGLPTPPDRWTIEEFERVGKAFVEAANRNGNRQRVFFVDLVNFSTLRRGMGRSVFNETMTRCTLNSPEAIRALELVRKWTEVDRLLPTQADLDFFAGSETNTSRIQLFARGRYALLTAARYSLVQLRESSELRLGVSSAPYEVFPNSLLGTGSVGIYRLSPHKDLAAYLLEFFTTETYNMHVVHTSSSMPPIPRYTETEAFLHPVGYPQEEGVHGAIAELMPIAIPPSVSPFILPSRFNRIEQEVRLAALAGIYSPAEGMALGEEQVNREIDLNVSSNPKLQEKYDRLCRQQEVIDRLRAAGEPVPLHLITNPFYRRYYLAQGWAVES